jgi:hypothetical protein
MKKSNSLIKSIFENSGKEQHNFTKIEWQD